jgi:hypothetical protein
MSVFWAKVSERPANEFLLRVRDGAGGHRAQRWQVPTHRRRIPWPPGSPPLNPVEPLWDEGREKWFAPRVFARMSAVEEQLITALKAWEQNLPRVASLTGFEWITTIPLNAH